MARTEKLSITLPLEMAKKVREMVQSGEYASNSEVMRNALRSLQKEETKETQKLAKLQAEIEKGINSGDAGILDFAELKTKAKNRLKTQQGG